MRSRRCYVLILVAVALAVLALFAGFAVRSNRRVQADRENVAAAYRAVQLGMTLEQAKTVIGRPQGLYSWRDCDRVVITSQEGATENVGFIAYFPGRAWGIMLFYDADSKSVLEKRLYNVESECGPMDWLKSITP